MSRSTLFALRRVFLALTGTLLFGIPAFSQVDTGAVRGTVTDPTGALIADAKVTLINEATGQTSATVTAKDGTYTFSPVKIGSYVLSVESPGFKKATTHVSVNVQEQARADFQLVTGAVTETVQVTSAAPQLQTQDASVGTVATSERDQ